MLIKAQELRLADVLLLPFNKTATISTVPKVGRQFVSFRTEYGSTRIEVGQEISINRKVTS